MRGCRTCQNFPDNFLGLEVFAPLAVEFFKGREIRTILIWFLILNFIIISMFPRPLLNENFDYSAGALTSGSADLLVSTGVLSYSQYASSSMGNKIFLNGGTAGPSGVVRSGDMEIDGFEYSQITEAEYTPPLTYGLAQNFPIRLTRQLKFHSQFLKRLSYRLKYMAFRESSRRAI